MKDIKHIFFDLDKTLWDYDKNAKETLIEIYDDLRIGDYGQTKEHFIHSFHEVNNKLWMKYNDGLINRDYIKNERFREIFHSLGIVSNFSEKASHYFITNCPLKSYLFPEVFLALDYLQKKYKLHIITNGFLDSQKKKLASSNMNQFFHSMVTSECMNYRKPSPEIFEYSLCKAGATKKNSIMIGDDPKTDIKGAQDFGMKAIFYDSSGRKKSLAAYTIQSHSELIYLF